ncbi:hypothetical protein Hanom_Chr09g00761891 [Helianthus anomalus]
MNDSANPFSEIYYKKAIYHRNWEQPLKFNHPQIKEGSSSKDKTRAFIVTQEDEGFDWSKYIPDEGPSAFVAKWVYNREEQIARKKLGDIEMIYKDAIDYNQALVKTIPTVEEEYEEVLAAMRKEKAETEVKLNAARSGPEIIDVTEDLTAEKMKKMADKALATKQNEVESSTISAELSNQVRSLNENVQEGKSIDEKCRHCINMCKICTEKENGLKSKIDELTQTEKYLKEANQKIDSLKDELVLKDKLIKGSKDKIDLLEENIRKGESEIERF